MNADEREYGQDPDGMAENARCNFHRKHGGMPIWDREEYACEKAERERDDAATGSDE